ncbi:DUF3120 domain-containing protein, partial [Synechocystis salina LEGE 06155]|nr:DUF3120 domain-containing protein [Synechocystis salina LEGE 06155]
MIPLLTTPLAQPGLDFLRRLQRWRSGLTIDPTTTGMQLMAGFLVSVPVFIQAPLVRQFPWLSLALTLPWVAIAVWLMKRPDRALWGDLLLG